MSDAWKAYASAPSAGVLVCETRAVEEGKARCVKVRSEAGEFPLLLIRKSGALRAFVNACPHQYLPLDWRSGNVLSADGKRLLCSAHGAAFDAMTGDCLAGEAGDGLDPVPVVEADGVIRIAAVEAGSAAD